MIDSKGRIFGKINIIDLFIVAVVCTTVGFIGLKFLSPKAILSVAQQDDVIVKFYTEGINDFVAEALNIGDVVTDEGRNVSLGKIIDLQFGDGYMYVPDSDGVLKASKKENYTEIEITSELKGQLFENGVIIDGNKYGVGHLFVIRAGKAKIQVNISDIIKKEV